MLIGRWRQLRERGRLTVGLVALAALYALVIGLGDARAWSGSDAGGKVATVKVMADTGSWVPDVGYWAEDADPEGKHHALWGTQRAGDHWLQATTLPMVYLGVPLWRLGGPTALLVLPALGALLAAYAARRLARAVAPTDGWAVFWLVGAASPVMFYASDFWEHAPAVGLALLACALALERGGPLIAGAAGVAAGVAVVMRTEMALYFLVLGSAALAAGAERDRWLRRPSRVAGVVVGGTVPLLLNAVLERLALGGGIRDQRVGSQVSAAGAEAGSRLGDALVTSIALWPSSEPLELLAGGLAVTMVGVSGSWALRGSPLPVPRWALLAGVLGGGLYLARLASGTGFVPGFLAAAVLAPVGIAAVAQREGRDRDVLLGITAIGALLPIWLLQWRGQLVPQWGGRYLLLSGALLTIVALVRLERVGLRRTGSAALFTLAVVVTAFGTVWRIERTNAMVATVEELEVRGDDVVLLSTLAHLGREAGAWYGDSRWLRADRRSDLESAAETASTMGAPLVDVVVLAGAADELPASLAGYDRRDVRSVDLLGFELAVVRYEAG